MIAPQVLVLSAFLSFCWGVYLWYTIREWRVAVGSKMKRVDRVPLFRRTIVAICVFMLPFSFLVRTAVVMAGFGNEIAGQVVFYALAGTNIPGAVFAALTVMRPEWFD